MIIAGPWIIIISLRLGIKQFQKLGKFLAVEIDRELPKHSPKIMFYSLIKYLACLFVLTFCTFNIFIYPMILVWGYVSYFIYKYIKLWRYHKYSVTFLICISVTVIISSILLSPYIRTGIGLRLT